MGLLDGVKNFGAKTKVVAKKTPVYKPVPYTAPVRKAAPAAFNLDLAKQIFGQQGEAKIEEIDSDKKFCLGVYADGLYERRNTDVGSFVYKKHDIKVPYLSANGETSFEYSLPQPPKGMLLGIAEFFYSIMQKMNNCEVMVQIWWDKATEEYELYLPEQEVAGASISFDHSEELQNDEDKIWVFDIHSHNTMGAFFSGTDSADEVSTRVFGVIGQIKADSFSSVWRAGVNGKFHKLTLDDLWDESDQDKSKWTIDPALVDERVKKFVRQTYTRATPTVGGAAAGGAGAKWVNGRQHVGNKPYNPIYSNVDDDFWNDADLMGGGYNGYGGMSAAPVTINHASTVSGRAKWDEVVPEDVQLDLEAFHEALDLAVMSEHEGNCGHTELIDTMRAFITFFSEFSSFDTTAAKAVFDQLQIDMVNVDFKTALVDYATEYLDGE